jgi:hypothetical protein
VTAKWAQMLTTSALLKPLHFIMTGLPRNSVYRNALSDHYVNRVKAGNPNPDCREVVRMEFHVYSYCECDLVCMKVESAMACMKDEDLDRVLGEIPDDGSFVGSSLESVHAWTGKHSSTSVFVTGIETTNRFTPEGLSKAQAFAGSGVAAGTQEQGNEDGNDDGEAADSCGCAIDGAAGSNDKCDVESASTSASA